jgi:ATP-binding cassette, subfamily B (MDR/TAP), member 1
MGTGHVIESGTHDELLASNSAYARLVSAQVLREQGGRSVLGTDQPDSATEKPADPLAMTEEEVQEAVQTEVPRDRTTTGSQRSLASEILEKRGKKGKKGEAREYSMYYFFKRMGRIVKEDWMVYSWGILFAACMCFFYVL